MIRFTNEGIFADTEGERQEFYRRQDHGDPIIIAHLDLWRKELNDTLVPPESNPRASSDKERE